MPADDALDGLEVKWEPHEGQRAVLNSDARFRIVAAGRRWGKTEMATMDLLIHACTHTDAVCWWVAPTHDQATIGWRAVRERVPESLLAPDGVRESRPPELTFRTGSTIRFTSAGRPAALRGWGIDFLVIDEAAQLDDATWTDVLRPTLTDTNGRLLAISTPAHRNWFWRAFQRGHDPDQDAYASFHARTTENPHIDDAEVAAQRHELPARSFKREYEAEFVDETGGVFTAVGSCVEAYDYDRAEGTPPYTIGVDFARTHDFTVVIALDAEGKLVAFERVREVGWPQIQALVERVAAQYSGPCYLDATRDNKIVVDLEDAGVQVEPVRFTAPRKRALIENLATQFEQGELTIPESPVLINELQQYEYETTPTGNVRYGAPTGFHDDCVDALALAAYRNYEQVREYRKRERHAATSLAVINAGTKPAGPWELDDDDPYFQ